ncbi:MAG TPA: flagellar biosynthesis protein FlhA, partial [Chthonomonadaceae bacterium]|nr:flagellar biosynthesis protein FlhA [Chthonomonadaceae bacterium]
QIPALLISTATGLLVTRAASERPMGQEFSAQLFKGPRPMLIVTGMLLFLMLIPGFPKLQLVVMAGMTGYGAFTLSRREKREEAQRRAAEAAEAAKTSQPPAGPESVMQHLGVETIEIELGSNLVPLALPDQGGDLAERVSNLRKLIALELGIVLPTVRIRDNLQLKSTVYQLKIKGAVVAIGELQPNSVLAVDLGMAVQRFEGIATVDPAFGMTAIWISRALKDRAEMAGYVVSDPSTVLITHLTETLKAHAFELLTRQETQKLVDHVKQTDEAAVNELIPNHLTLGEVQKVLQGLLKERVGIRDLATILETLADYAPRTKDLDALTEFSRAALARQICKQHQDSEDGVLRVITLAPSLEQELREAVQVTPTGNMLAIDPTLAQAIIRELTAQVEHAAEQGHSPVLLCSGQIRLPMKRLIERSLPTLPVMAYTEIVPKMEVEAVATVEPTLQLTPA